LCSADALAADASPSFRGRDAADPPGQNKRDTPIPGIPLTVRSA
jgi:hypothetical protein